MSCGGSVFCALAAQQQGVQAKKPVEERTNCASTVHIHTQSTHRPKNSNTFPKNSRRHTFLSHLYGLPVFHGLAGPILADVTLICALLGRGVMGMAKLNVVSLVLCHVQRWRVVVLAVVVGSE